MATSTIPKVLDNKTLAVLGSSNAAGEVTLSEPYTNYCFVVIAINEDGYYKGVEVIPSETMQNIADSDKYAILRVNQSDATVNVVRYYRGSTTSKIYVAKPCYIYGYIRKA